MRGLVASATGRKYTGLDIRKEQIAANKRAKRHLPGPAPKWLALDAAEIAGVQRGKEFDLVFTCPPFFEMERYSELERDLSTMAPEDFQQAYAAILAAAAARLADHRFMVIITGDVRGEDGGLLNLFEQTREAICGALPCRHGTQRTSCHRSHPILCAPARPLKRAEKWGGHINTSKSF